MFARTHDGAEIFYELYDFTQPWKDAETVLLHHGSRANHKMWHAWIPLLSRKYRVAVFDARGRGNSTVPDQGFDWSMEQFTTDALTVADAAGADQFHWLGTSFGSVVGQYVGAKHGDRLKTLSLLSPPYRFTNLSDVKKQWLVDYDRLGRMEFVRRDAWRIFGENADPGMVEWHAQQMATMPDHVWKDLQPFTAGINLANILSDISVPTLILASSGSDRAPASEAEFIKEQIPDCELIVLGEEHNIVNTRVNECAVEVLKFIEKKGS